MAYAGKEVQSPTTRLVFEQTASDTNGELLQFKQFVAGNSPEVQEHVHLRAEERFMVLSGRMGVRMAGSERVMGPGDEITVPPRTPHTFWNAGSEELHHMVELRPAGNMETFFETVYGLQKDGRFPVEGEKRTPNPFQGALILTQYDFFIASVPVPLRNLLFRPLAFVGRRLGYRASYPRYSRDG